MLLYIAMIYNEHKSKTVKTSLNTFMPTVPTFAVRETDVSRTANVGTVGKNWFRKCNGGQKWIKTMILHQSARKNGVFRHHGAPKPHRQPHSLKEALYWAPLC